MLKHASAFGLDMKQCKTSLEADAPQVSAVEVQRGGASCASCSQLMLTLTALCAALQVPVARGADIEPQLQSAKETETIVIFDISVLVAVCIIVASMCVFWKLGFRPLSTTIEVCDSCVQGPTTQRFDNQCMTPLASWFPYVKIEHRRNLFVSGSGNKVAEKHTQTRVSYRWHRKSPTYYTLPENGLYDAVYSG